MPKKDEKIEFDDDFDNSREARKIKYRQTRHKTKQLMKKIATGQIEPDAMDDFEEEIQGVFYETRFR